MLLNQIEPIRRVIFGGLLAKKQYCDRYDHPQGEEHLHAAPQPVDERGDDHDCGERQREPDVVEEPPRLARVARHSHVDDCKEQAQLGR